MVLWKWFCADLCLLVVISCSLDRSLLTLFLVFVEREINLKRRSNSEEVELE